MIEVECACCGRICQVDESDYDEDAEFLCEDCAEEFAVAELAA